MVRNEERAMKWRLEISTIDEDKRGLLDVIYIAYNSEYPRVMHVETGVMEAHIVAESGRLSELDSVSVSETANPRT
jgi:hypothetical protein